MNKSKLYLHIVELLLKGRRCENIQQANYLCTRKSIIKTLYLIVNIIQCVWLALVLCTNTARLLWTAKLINAHAVWVMIFALHWIYPSRWLHLKQCGLYELCAHNSLSSDNVNIADMLKTNKTNSWL